ncbi:MAG: PH domain-containing protein [Candidatus Yanofskybacteria bacterium]|nr:PH domain-containing protein [Candidatus Yanofskybacteria bacterium]
MKQLDPKAVWLFFFSFLFRWLSVLVVLGFLFFGAWYDVMKTGGVASFNFINWINNWLWVVIPALLVLLIFIWAKLTYHFYHYELTDNGFRKELGVIYKQYVTIPYDRVQNVDIYRGILARLLGLSDLQVQTAGVSGRITSEGRLPGLSREVAEQLRDEIIQRALQLRGNQGL